MRTYFFELPAALGPRSRSEQIQLPGEPGLLGIKYDLHC